MKNVSIIIPVFNEEKNIVSVLSGMLGLFPDSELIVVDDGSTDRTPALLSEYSGKVTALRLPSNSGKGCAVRKGLEKVSRRWVAIQDADREYDPEDLKRILVMVEEKEYPAVYGSRFLTKNPVIYPAYYLGNYFISYFISFLYRARITDSYTAYKVVETGILRSLGLQARRFELEAEITCKLLKKGYPIREIPIGYRPRTIGEGKKIKWTDALEGFATAARIYFQ